MREHSDESFEFDVSVIGLGAMGTIMAQVLLKQGKRVAIWNRSPGKAAALVAAGAHLCESVKAALSASPATIFVLLDNHATHEVLGMPGVARALAHRTIVDYTTNAQDEGLALQGLVNQAGGHYVKGMIVAYPATSATAKATAFIPAIVKPSSSIGRCLRGSPAIRCSFPGTKHWPLRPSFTRMRLPRW